MLPNAAQTEAMLENGATPTQDISQTVMDNMFGAGWENYFLNATGAGPFTLLFELFKYINTIAFAMTTFLIVFISISGVLGTAHEGVSLGRRYSTLWTPIRSVMAVAALIPLPNIGLSALQGLILLAVSHGIGGANHLWGLSLDYMQNEPATLVTMDVDHAASLDGEILTDSIIKSATTQAYLSQMGSHGESTAGAAQINTTWTPDVFSLAYLNTIANPKRMPENGEGGTYYINFQAPSSMGNLQDSLGGVAIECDSQDSTCERKRAAITTLINDIYPSAQAIVENRPPPRNGLMDAKNQYSETLAKINKDRMTQEQAGLTGAIQDFTNKAKSGGWMLAGSWYWTIASIQEKTRDFITEHRIRPSLMDNEAISENVHPEYSGVMEAAESYTAFSVNDATTAANLEKTYEDSGWFFRTFNKATNSIRDGSLYLAENMTALLTEGDPIQNMKHMGDYLIGIGETAIVTYVGYEVVSAFTPKNMMATSAETLRGVATNKGDDTDPLTALLIMGMLTPIFTLGLLLSYYLPTLPFYIWMSSVITWLLLIFEALVAAPLIAVGIAIPEGEGFIGPHSRRSIFLIINIVFRPLIMITVFFFVFYAIKIITWIIGIGYILFFNGLYTSPFTGVLTIFMIVFLIGVFLIFVVDRLFSLISIVPTAIFNWIEGGASHLADNGRAYEKTSALSAAGTGAVGAVTKEGLKEASEYKGGKGKSRGSSGSRTTNGDFSPGEKIL